MTPRPENEFPTITDLRDRLSELINRGFGDLPVKILVVPDSTLQVIAETAPGTKPALMVELSGDCHERMPVGLICAERLFGDGMPTRAVQ